MSDRFGTVVYSRSKLSNENITSGAISSVEEESPDKVKSKNVRRKVLPNSSFSMSDSDEEEQRSCLISRNRLAPDGEFFYNCSRKKPLACQFHDALFMLYMICSWWNRSFYSLMCMAYIMLSTVAMKWH